MFQRKTQNRARHRQRDAVQELDKIRAPLLGQLDTLLQDRDYYKGRPSHRCCTRESNQMRISPLEAQAIADAFQTDSRLREKLPEVLERLRAELPRLRNNDERQSFDCPLLDGTQCLVHHKAKPIGCTAWHPREHDDEDNYTRQGWKAFEKRDILNDRFHGPDWKLRVIPLWLKRVFARQLNKLERNLRRTET